MRLHARSDCPLSQTGKLSIRALRLSAEFCEVYARDPDLVNESFDRSKIFVEVPIRITTNALAEVSFCYAVRRPPCNSVLTGKAGVFARVARVGLAAQVIRSSRSGVQRVLREELGQPVTVYG